MNANIAVIPKSAAKIAYFHKNVVSFWGKAAKPPARGLSLDATWGTVLRTPFLPIHFKWSSATYDDHLLLVGCPNMLVTNPRWRTVAILKILKNCHISGTVWPIATKLCKVMHIDPFTHIGS